MSRPALLQYLLLIVAACGLTGCQQSRAGYATDDSGPPLARVTVISPAQKTLVRTVELPGHAEAFEVTPLYAKVSGYITRIPVDIGATIQGSQGDKPGTVLCELLVPELREELAQKGALVQQVESEVLQAEASVKLAEASIRSAAARVQEMRAAVATEDAQLARWQSEFDRVVQLAESGAVTRKVADETRAQLDASKSGREEVLARIEVSEAVQQETEAALEKAKSDALAIRSQLAVAQAEERRLAAMLDYATIRAPYDGVAVERNAHTGHLVNAGSGEQRPPLVVMRLDPVRVIVDVPEIDAVRIQPGAQVELRTPSSPDQSHIGTVTRIAWSLNDTSRTMKAEIDVPNPTGSWRPGQFVQVKLTVASLENVLSLPKTAIVTQDKQTYCYVVGANDKVAKLQVSIGLQAGNDFEIRDGLTGAERVIGVNPSAFREGQSVVVAAPPEVSAAQ